jgi:hypothetical protein
MGLAHRTPGGLSRRATLMVGQALAQAAVLPQAHARGDRIGQRETAAWRLGSLRGTLGTAAPAVVALV